MFNRQRSNSHRRRKNAKAVVAVGSTADSIFRNASIVDLEGRLTVGQFKKVDLKDVPESYLTWLLSCNLHPASTKTIQQEISTRK